LALLLEAAVLQGINLFAVCYIQYSYGQETRLERLDGDVFVFLALTAMSPSQRDEFLSSLSPAQSGARRPSRFTVRDFEPEWESDGSHPATRAIEYTPAALAELGSRIPVVKGRAIEWPAPPNQGEGEIPVLQLTLELGDDSWLETLQPIHDPNLWSVWIQRLFIFLESILFSYLLILIVKKATRPLERLGQAAERFGHNPEIVEPLAETGSQEAREVAHSFNRMRELIRENLEVRNRMLEAMGHDLSAPLAKIKLRIDKTPTNDLRERLSGDINEIESIVEQGLELARSLQTSEEIVLLDVFAFTQSIVDDMAEQGLAVSSSESYQSQGEPILARARPICLKRCLENLLTNAVKYAGVAKVSLALRGTQVLITVDDDGPGIPEECLEKVFEPFFRLERSRNRNLGGTGLGLSIARNMALLNNGSLKLSNRPGGGLTASVALESANALGR
jgi:signal transduction histidine kinase